MKEKPAILSILGYAIVFSFYFFLAYFLWCLNIEYEIMDLSFFSLSKKTEIAQFRNPGSKCTFEYGYGYAMEISFVISNPPEDKDSLLSLVSNHFQSFAQIDTIKKYVFYRHRYLEENTFTRRGYNAAESINSFRNYYLDKRGHDLLVEISVYAKHNEQEIFISKKANKKTNKNEEIVKAWREK